MGKDLYVIKFARGNFPTFEFGYRKIADKYARVIGEIAKLLNGVHAGGLCICRGGPRAGGGIRELIRGADLKS
jgi:hypothetical protein